MTVYSAVCFTNSLLFLFALSVFVCVIVVYFCRLLFQPSSYNKGIMQGWNFLQFFSCFHGMQMSHKENLTLLYKCFLLSARFPCNCCEEFAHEYRAFCDAACILSMFVGWIISLDFCYQEWLDNAHSPSHSRQSETSDAWKIISRFSEKELHSIHVS